MGQLRPIFAYFRSFQTQICTKTSVGFELGLLEGEHADHLNATTFHYLKYVAHGALPWLSGFVCAFHPSSLAALVRIPSKSF